MAGVRTISLLSAGLSMVAVQLMLLGAVAAEAGTPSDVPDEFGLGERLALVSWLNDHHVAVADPNDVPTLRRTYVAKATPDLIPKPESASMEQQRADLASGAVPQVRSQSARRRRPRGHRESHDCRLDRARERGGREQRDQANSAQANALAQPRSRPPPIVGAPVAPPSGIDAPAPDPPAEAPAPRDNARAAAGIAIGKPFPPLTGTCIDGSSFSLSDWKGKVVLIDAWATWCHPCRKELPNVVAAYRTFHARGLEVLGISMDSDLAKLRPVLISEHIDWPTLMEGFGTKGPLATRLVITYIPTNFLIDANAMIIGFDLRGPALQAALEKALGAAP